MLKKNPLASKTSPFHSLIVHPLLWSARTWWLIACLYSCGWHAGSETWVLWQNHLFRISVMFTHGKQFLNPMMLAVLILQYAWSTSKQTCACTYTCTFTHKRLNRDLIKALNIRDEKHRSLLIRKTLNLKLPESGVKSLSCGSRPLMKFPVDFVKCPSGCTKADN